MAVARCAQKTALHVFGAKSRFIRSLLLAGGLLCGTATAQNDKVDVALVLAIDCSFSVDAEEFRLQMLGLGRALQDPAVAEAIKAGPNGRIAVLAFQWSDTANQNVVLPWTIISSAEDAVQLGRKIASTKRQLAEGGTSTSNAMLFGMDRLEAAPPAVRKVIDISTDGRNNIGPPLPVTRNLLLAEGIIINALVITNEFPTLDIYAEKQIIGGQGAFVIKANSYAEYHKAILQKLLKEIMGPGIA